MKRRELMKTAGASASLLAVASCANVPVSQPVKFTHGVASGDPLANRVILWTRVTAESQNDSIDDIVWQVASDRQFKSIKASGLAATSASRDYTVKVDATGLAPNTRYFYRFLLNGTESPIGSTKTLPRDGVAPFRLGVASCSNYPQGYFHAYRDMANSELDLVLHLGDYLYEYAIQYNSARQDYHDPQWEIVDVQDYRRRHAKYAEDEGLANLRAAAPMIAMWDDHEFTNNPYGNGMGADNHQPECEGNRTHPGDACTEHEGSFLERANRAAQAYFEWLPIRRGPRPLSGQIDTDLTQVVEWGAVATFLLQDTRIEARPEHGTIGLLDPSTGEYTLSAFNAFMAATYGVANPTDVTTYTAEDFASTAAYVESQYSDPQYELLGAEQREILEKTFATSKAAGKVWQIYGSSVVMADQIGMGDMYKLAERHPGQPMPFQRFCSGHARPSPSDHLSCALCRHGGSNHGLPRRGDANRRHGPLPRVVRYGPDRHQLESRLVVGLQERTPKGLPDVQERCQQRRCALGRRARQLGVHPSRLR